MVQANFIQAAIYAHVGAGSLWTLAALAIAVTGHAARPLLRLQTAAALVAVAVGIGLWHALHAGPFGPIEHVLVVGSFLALIALGLQLGIAAPALFRATALRLAGGGLMLYRASVVILAAAAVAMVGSLLR